MYEGLLPGGIIAAVALAMLYKAFDTLKKARTIEDVPTSKIRSAHQGYVELTGITRAHGDITLKAPLTGTGCIWYEYKIERYQGGKSSHWITVEKNASDRFFVLFDGSAECVVDPRRSEVLTSHKKQWNGYLRHPGKLQETSLLGRLRRQRYRYTERRIHSDQPLYAIGRFHTLHASSKQKQEADYASKLLNSWKQDYEKLLARFDEDDNGQVDLQEWQRARHEAASQARQHVAENYDDSDLHTMSKPANGQAYILSTSDPEEIATRYRRSTMTLLAASLVLGGFALLFVLNKI